MLTRGGLKELQLMLVERIGELEELVQRGERGLQMAAASQASSLLIQNRSVGPDLV